MKKVSKTKIEPQHIEFLRQLGAKVEEIRKERNVKIKDLVADVNLHRNSYSQMAHGKTYFKTSALLKVLDYFNVDYFEFLKKISEDNPRVGTKKGK
jgi:transcriptional regulator with XRE-family HTH domain